MSDEIFQCRKLGNSKWINVSGGLVSCRVTAAKAFSMIPKNKINHGDVVEVKDHGSFKFKDTVSHNYDVELVENEPEEKEEELSLEELNDLMLTWKWSELKGEWHKYECKAGNCMFKIRKKNKKFELSIWIGDADYGDGLGDHKKLIHAKLCAALYWGKNND